MRMSDDVRNLNNLEDVPVKLPKPHRKNEDKKELLVEAIKQYGQHLPKYKSEFRFLADRQYRFDLAYLRQRVAIEVDGGQWMKYGGRHSRDSDRWKMAEAAAMGWRVIHLSPEMIKADPVRCIDCISRALGL